MIRIGQVVHDFAPFGLPLSLPAAHIVLRLLTALSCHTYYGIQLYQKRYNRVALKLIRVTCIGLKTGVIMAF